MPANSKSNKQDLPGLHLYFREIYNKAYKAPIGFQTQMNIVDEKLGILTPGQYIPVSEISNQCVRLATWQVEILCRLMPGMDESGRQYEWLSIHVSNAAMDKEGFADRVLELIEERKKETNLFAFELDANVLDHITNVIEENVQKLRKAGCKIIIRNYGSAYSTVMSICKMPVDFCIIDNSLATYITGSESEQTLYKTLVSMLKELDIEIISDGIDNKKIYDKWEAEFDSENAVGKKIGQWIDEDRLGVNRREITPEDYVDEDDEDEE